MHITTNNINALLVQEDVEGLIDAGAPPDEYLDEAAQITAALLLLEQGQLTEENILSTLSLVWLRSFELSEQDVKLRVSALERIAQKILT